MIENPQGKKQEKKEEGIDGEKDKKGEKTEQKGQSWLVDQARELGEGIIERTRELFGSDGGSPEIQEKKKEAAGALSTMGFGTATLGGFIALLFAGVVLGAQKLSAWSKSFDAGFKLAGGGKGGGGKKEKA